MHANPLIVRSFYTDTLVEIFDFFNTPLISSKAEVKSLRDLGERVYRSTTTYQNFCVIAMLPRRQHNQSLEIHNQCY